MGEQLNVNIQSYDPEAMIKKCKVLGFIDVIEDSDKAAIRKGASEIDAAKVQLEKADGTVNNGYQSQDKGNVERGMAEDEGMSARDLDNMALEQKQGGESQAQAATPADAINSQTEVVVASGEMALEQRDVMDELVENNEKTGGDIVSQMKDKLSEVAETSAKLDEVSAQIKTLEE